MAIKIIEQRFCDWCGNSDENESVDTHTLSWDKRTVAIDVHATCEADATIEWLLDHGRKVATTAPVNSVAKLPCPIAGCAKSGNGAIGVAQHLARAHGDVTAAERRILVDSIKERQA